MVFLLAILLAVYAQSLSSAQNATGEESFKTLHQLMEEGIHERFTFLSFTLWHDPPMTPEKMEAIAQSAIQLRQLAETITALRPGYLEAESRKAERKAFDAQAEELSTSARMLAEAATRKDKARTQNLFNRVEASCQSCHAKFNKALANK
jgi:cytochrome c556